MTREPGRKFHTRDPPTDRPTDKELVRVKSENVEIVIQRKISEKTQIWRTEDDDDEFRRSEGMS